MPDVCDLRSVGVDITNPDGLHLIIKRSDGLGWAVVAGHEDPHGSPEKAAAAETKEEVGLKLIKASLVHTVWLPNRCSGSVPEGVDPGHKWSLYKGEVADATRVDPDPREVSDTAWVEWAWFEEMASRTVDLVRKGQPLSRWPEEFLEPPQVALMDDAGWLNLPRRDVQMVIEHCRLLPSQR